MIRDLYNLAEYFYPNQAYGRKETVKYWLDKFFSGDKNVADMFSKYNIRVYKSGFNCSLYK
jgi:hypothetical protein